MHLRFTILITLATLASLAILLSTSIPLGIPGEWQWNRHAPIADLASILDRLILPFAGGSLLIVVAVFARPAESRLSPSKLRKLGSYSLLAIVAGVWLHGVQQAAPAFHRDVKPYWVLYSPSSSGYFFEAAFKIDSTAGFLASYEDRMSEGEVLHVGTHPPGLFLLARACINACDASPTLVSLLKRFEDKQSRETFRQLESEARLALPLNKQQQAGLCLLTLLSQLLLVLTIIPLAVLAGKMFSSKVAWQLCCLWPTLPCLAVFFPKSDVLFPFFSMTTLAFSVLALSGIRPTLCSVAAGLTLWIGLMLSLALIPTAAVLFFFVIIQANETKARSLKLGATVGLLIIITIAICSSAFSIITDCNIVNVWNWNLTNHAGFYEQFQRTWSKWLVVNPIELFFSVAAPVGILAIAGLRSTFLTATKKEDSHTRPGSTGDKFSKHLAWAITLVVVLLWASGKNQGEAARLWCFMAPWLLTIAGHALTKLDDRQFVQMLTLQTVSAIITVGTVNGFSF